MTTSIALLLLVAQSWSDPSPHQTRFIPVEPGVQLEVLDWGGSGPPLVLLAGYLSAHAYDELAPKLTTTHHVYGISRRGYGGSSRPASGYTAQRSADDVIAVIQALHLRGVILAGHSWGGQDLNTIGARHAEPIAALVYINSAEDPTLTTADYDIPPNATPPPPKPPAPPPDKSSFDACRAWQLKTYGVAFPESELRQTFTANPDGSLGSLLVSQHARDAIFAGRVKPEYARIRVPVLALVSVRDNASAADAAIAKRHRDDLTKGVPHAHIVDVPSGNFYLFVSHPDLVARQIQAFSKSLPALQ